MTEEITEVVDEWAEFRVGGQIHLFILGDASILKELVPKDAHALGQVFDEDGEYVRQKTVEEFVSGGENESNGHIWLSPDGSEAIILGCAMEGSTWRQHRFGDMDAAQWKHFKELVWSDRAELINYVRVLEKLTEWGLISEGEV